MGEHQTSQRENGTAAECRGMGSGACNSPVGARELNTSPRGRLDSLDEKDKQSYHRRDPQSSNPDGGFSETWTLPVW